MYPHWMAYRRRRTPAVGRRIVCVFVCMLAYVHVCVCVCVCVYVYV